MIEPRHPLFGRRFRLVSITGALVSAGYARAEYRPGITLMLPLPVTSLWPHPERCAMRTKLSAEVLRELVAIAGESEGACPLSPATSGKDCRRRFARRSPVSSLRSSGR